MHLHLASLAFLPSMEPQMRSFQDATTRNTQSLGLRPFLPSCCWLSTLDLRLTPHIFYHKSIPSFSRYLQIHSLLSLQVLPEQVDAFHVLVRPRPSRVSSSTSAWLAFLSQLLLCQANKHHLPPLWNPTPSVILSIHPCHGFLRMTHMLKLLT